MPSTPESGRIGRKAEAGRRFVVFFRAGVRYRTGMARLRRVMVVGSGGREHALALKLLESESVGEVVVVPGNGGTVSAPPWIPTGKQLGNAAGPAQQVARRGAIDLAVIGPEVPLCAGLADELAAMGIRTYGPSASAARLEGSKAFMKRFADRHGIKTAAYDVVTSMQEARAVIERGSEPPVVKADGLCAGKGVVVAADREEALRAAEGMLSGEWFGDAGRTVVLERRLSGAEVSVHAICDGERAVVLPMVQDHKRIGDGDTGPNTGGMGTCGPAPLVTPALARRIEVEFVGRIVAGMAADGIPYRGTLFAGLMIGADGEPSLLEINVRFGDPETQVLTHLLDGDFAEALDLAASGRLRPEVIEVNDRHAVCVVLAAAGYPGAPRHGDPIVGLDRVMATPDVRAYHAGTQRVSTGWVTSGGRVLGMTGVGASLREAYDRAYRAAESVTFAGCQMRHDIGAAMLKYAGAAGGQGV